MAEPTCRPDSGCHTTRGGQFTGYWKRCTGLRRVMAFCLCGSACWRTSLLSLDRIGHIEQAYGFPPVWVRLCRRTALLSPNRIEHIEQAYRFSPVCARSCGATLLLLLNRIRTPRAHQASVWLLACVGPLVRGNGALLGEPLGAHRASVWLLTRVRPLVRGNGALLGEPHKKSNASGSMQIFPQYHLGGPPGFTATTFRRKLQDLGTGTSSNRMASRPCGSARAGQRRPCC